MEETVHVEVARTVERDELVGVLRERGLEARPVGADDMPAIEIPCGEDAGRLCEEVVAELERWIAESGVDLVPLVGDGGVSLRPPGS